MVALFKIPDMKVRIIKGSKAGEIVEATDKRAAYWQRVGLAEEATDTPKKSAKKETPKKTAKKKK